MIVYNEDQISSMYDKAFMKGDMFMLKTLFSENWDLVDRVTRIRKQRADRKEANKNKIFGAVP